MIHCSRYFYWNKIIFSINSGMKRYDQHLPRSFWRRRKTKIKEQFVSLKIFDPAFSKNGARPRHTGQFVGGKVVKGSNVGGSIFSSRQPMPVNRWWDPSFAVFLVYRTHGEKNSGNKFPRRLMARYTILLPQLLQSARFLWWKIAMAATYLPAYLYYIRSTYEHCVRMIFRRIGVSFLLFSFTLILIRGNFILEGKWFFQLTFYYTSDRIWTRQKLSHLGRWEAQKEKYRIDVRRSSDVPFYFALPFPRSALIPGEKKST